jgi:hypothetical protein
MGQKRPNPASISSSFPKENDTSQLVPITLAYIDGFLKESDNMKICFEKDLEGSTFYLEQIYSILNEENELSLEFISRFKSLGLFDSLISLFMRPNISLSKLELLAMIMSYCVIDDQLLLNKLINKEFVTVIVKHFDDPKLLDHREILNLAQFFELLLEDNSGILENLDKNYVNNLHRLCQEPGQESALCIANLLIEHGLCVSVLAGHCEVFKKFTTGGNDPFPVDYLCKLLKVLTNHIGVGQNLPPFVGKFIENLFLSKVGFKAVSKEPKLFSPIACFFANVIPILPENILMNLDDLFELIFEDMRNNLQDSEIVESATSLMRSLSLTGLWAANSADVLALINNNLYNNIVPISFYTLKHSQGSPSELTLIKEALVKLSLNSPSNDLKEEVLLALGNLEN